MSAASSLLLLSKRFSPRSLPGLGLWLDASDPSTLYDATTGGSLVAANGAVARLEDKSGNGRHLTQATLNNRPLRKTSVQNGRDALEFDGTNDFLERLNSGLNAQADFCYVAVHRFDIPAAATWAVICGLKNDLGLGSGQPLLQRRSTTTQLGTHDAGRVDAGTFVDAGAQLGAWRVSLLQRSGGTSGNGGTVYLRSNALTATTTQNWAVGSPDTRFTVGDAQQSGLGLFKGNIAEVFALPRALATSEQTNVFAYLSAKWGITV